MYLEILELFLSHGKQDNWKVFAGYKITSSSKKYKLAIYKKWHYRKYYENIQKKHKTNSTRIIFLRTVAILANSIKQRTNWTGKMCVASTKTKGGPGFKAIMWIVFHMKNAMSQKFCDKWQSGRCLEFHRGMQHNLIKKEGLERKSVTWRLAGGLVLDESGNSLSHCCQHFLMWTLRLIGGACQVSLQTFPAIPSPTVPHQYSALYLAKNKQSVIKSLFFIFLNNDKTFINVV